MNKANTKLWLLLTTLFALALTTFTLTYIVTAPWHEMPELGADGGKNIYTYLYQVLYGHGIWFRGMNYPYGEHIVYTDGQPLLSVPLSLLKHRVSIGTALTIMWWLVALSYILSIIYCFKILLQFKVKPLIAMCFAGLITIFSPQLFRISGHYALSVCCILPMLFYWSLQYYNSSRYKYLVYIFILGAMATFLHPYYAAVSLVWAGCYAVGYFVTRKATWVAKLKHTVPMLLSVVAVFALFGIFMKLTDPAKDRPTTPYGILINCTTGKDILSSSVSPIWSAIASRFKSIEITEGGEGRVYLGLAIICACFISLVWGIRSKIKRDTSTAIVSENEFQPIWLIMAAIALLFSMGVPFTWGMEWLLDYASALKQFRTLGRFSWIFYYIIAIYGSVVVYKLYERLMVNDRKIAANAVLLFALGLWSLEASGYIARTHKKLEIGYHAYDTFVCTGQTNWEQFLQQHNYKKEDFQATIVLPFFEVGSEKLWVGNDENISAWGIAMGIQAGIQLHLPMMDGMMSRTSWDVAFNQVKIVGGPYTDKPMLNTIKSRKSFLLITLNVGSLTPDEQTLLESAVYIGDYQNCKIYACAPLSLIAKQQITAGYFDEHYSVQKDTDTCTHNNTGNWYTNHFNDRKNTKTLAGAGSAFFEQVTNPVIANVPVFPVTGDQIYEFSCWFLCTANDYKSPVVLVETLDSSGHILSSKEALAKESTDNSGLWLRTNTYFTLPQNARFIKCTVRDLEGHNFEAMDELMVKPAASIIVSRFTDGSVLLNNHIINQKIK